MNMNDPKVIICEQDLVDSYARGVNAFEAAFGRPALITDESDIGDFSPTMGYVPEKDERFYAAISEALNLEIKYGMKIWQIAKRWEEQNPLKSQIN